MQTLLLRSEGGFAPAPGVLPSRQRLPETPPVQRIAFALPGNAALLYHLNGNFNPLHSDPDLAVDAGFRQPIMHGMGTFGSVTRHLMTAVCDNDPSRFAASSMRLSAPAYPVDRFTLQRWEGARLPWWPGWDGE